MTALSFSEGLLPALLFAAAIVVAIPGILSVVRVTRANRETLRRLAKRPADASPGPDRSSGFGAALMEMASHAAPAQEAVVSAARAKLNRAGFTAQRAVGLYFFARLVCVVLPQLGLLLALPSFERLGLPGYAPIAASLMLVLVGLAAPGKFLDHRIAERRKACSAGFPDMMDLMVSCVEAGLSLDAAVQRVGEELDLRHPVIAGHLRTLSLELRAGRARKAAWRAFADRMDIEEAGSLATMLRQAEEMGTSLGATLRVFSADMRQRRILYAEEKAMALPAKLTLPLILFVFPVLLGVLTLPAVVMLGSVMG